MKREIDHWDIWKRSLEDLELEFCDVLTELSEYRLEKTKRIQRIVQKFVNKLIQKYLRNSTGNVLRVSFGLWNNSSYSVSPVVDNFR